MARRKIKKMSGGQRKSRRKQLLKKSGDIAVCGLCGHPIKPGTETLDHIRPKSKGGSNRLGNLQLAHSWCNNLKGNGSAIFFSQEEILEHLLGV